MYALLPEVVLVWTNVVKSSVETATKYVGNLNNDKKTYDL